jgi:hypothetical protein
MNRRQLFLMGITPLINVPVLKGIPIIPVYGGVGDTVDVFIADYKFMASTVLVNPKNGLGFVLYNKVYTPTKRLKQSEFLKNVDVEYFKSIGGFIKYPYCFEVRS